MLARLKSWFVVRRAKREVEDVAHRFCPAARIFSRMGVCLRNVTFCVATPAERERDQMRSEPDLYQELRKALLHAGFPADVITSVTFRVESQEAVDRDYGGSWQEESDMP